MATKYEIYPRLWLIKNEKIQNKKSHYEVISVYTNQKIW